MVEPWIIGKPKIEKRWQEEYRAEVLENKCLLEGRFDTEAAQADPGNIEVDSEEIFTVAEDVLHCGLDRDNDSWANQVIDVQFYDDANRATFGYASIGVFGDSSPEGDSGNLEPQPPIVAKDGCKMDP